MLLHTFHDKEQLFFLLHQGTLVLTPNNRLSNSIIQQYFEWRKEQTLDKPNCMPYRIALTKAYEYLQFINPHEPYPLLLNTMQCHYLWRSIIQADPSINYSEGLLQAVIKAWEHCQLWQIDPNDPSFLNTAQTRQFQQWWQLLEKRLNQQDLITEYQLIPRLLNTPNGLFSTPIVWVCFDEFTPQQVQLQQQLIHQGFTQYHYDLQERPSKTELLAAQDDKEEYQQLISWLHLQISEKRPRIGVVVPNLEQESPYLQRLLARHFDSSLFNSSLGQALSHFPLVAHALCWLSLENTTLTQHQVCLLLQSPYLDCSQEEFLARSELLQNSALLEHPLISLKSLLKELQIKAPKLATLLDRLIVYPKTATLHKWIELFLERLHILGFPGDCGLNSENYQCYTRFTLLFDELQQLAVLNAQFRQEEALEALQHLADQTIFQAKKNNAPIQISGLLEASGCEFDRLWVMGLTDQCLPQSVHLSAFIPIPLQRELQMPHSQPSRELQFARQILHRLQQSADGVVFSYPQLQGDTPNLPCSLIAMFPHFSLLPITNSILPQPKLEQLEECYKVPLVPEEPISGGTAILSNQAKCPFKAFAQHRLQAKAPLQATDGLSPKERGQMIHQVMELLWTQLESQQQLNQLTTYDLEHVINKAIHATLDPLKQQPTELFSTAIHEIEYTRLKRLVLTYLEWEKQREPFIISALEQSYSLHLGGLDFQVRVDRLDQVGDKKWVIDYKSSLPASRPWNEERPKETQLLLYALLDDQINTLLLMQLKAGTIICAGLSEEKQNIRGITSLKKEETWTECRNAWNKQLAYLAMEFQQGHCSPQPAQPSICQQCEFQSLCRFEE